MLKTDGPNPGPESSSTQSAQIQVESNPTTPMAPPKPEVVPSPPVPPYSARMRPFYRLAHDAVALWSRLWLRLEVHGLENFPDDGPVLLLPTHTSFLDPPLLGSQIPRMISYLARDGILKVPILGTACRWLNTVGIRRGGGDRQALRICQAILRGGSPLVYFPEGTRSSDGRLGPLQRGFVLILEPLKDVPYVPVVMQDTYRVLRRGRLFPRPRKVHIHIGEPARLPPRRQAEPARQYHQRCVEDLERRLRELGTAC